MLMENKFQSKTYPQGTRTIWRYLSALILLFSLSIGQMWADEIFGFTCTSSTTAVSSTGYTATGGTATLSGSAMSTGGSNEMTVGTQTFYKFNSSSQWTFALSSGKFAVGDVISFTCASNASSDKSGKGVKINNSITVTGDFPKGETNTISYTVVASDGVAGQSSFYIKRNDSDIKFGTVSVTRTATGPVDPTITFNNGAYTVGDEVLDLSSLFTSNSAGAVTYSVKTDGGTSASISGTSFSASAAGTAVVTASQAAETGKYNAKAVDANIVVSAAPSATTPSFTSPASEPAVAEYSVGDAISALEVVAAGYPAPTLQWYSNSSKSTEGATLITGAESASYTPSNAAVSDLYFYCVATNASGTAQSEYFHVTVAAVSYCAELYPATSGASPTQKNEELLLQTEAPNASYGGKIYTAGAKSDDYAASFTYTANGLQLNKGGADSARVELNHLMKVGTVITATLVNPDDGKARGYKLLNMSKTVKATWQATTTDPQVYTYTVVAGDGLAGTNMFLLNRAESSALKELKVSNCGAELLALTSAVSVTGKATVTLSKSLVAAGGSATASYSDIDAAYEFDGWEITTGDATIADPTAATAAITMGTTASTITLKLKAAEVKHTVTYYDGETELGTEQVVEGQNPTGASLAPRKLGYTFAGWSTTNGGDATALTGITVSADMPLYAVWNAVNCATKSGTIYTMSIVVAPLANCTITSTTGTHDLYQYEGVSGGEALLGNKGTSNNCILQTNKTVLLKDDNSYIKLDFDCPLKEGDKIVYSVGSNNPVLSTGNSKPSTPLATLDRSKTEFVIPAESGLIDAQTVYVWKGGGNTTVTYINIVRPEKFDVTFNMQGHGTQVEPQNILGGGKVEEPATTDITGWDFGGWFTNAACSEGKEWAFATATVSQDTVLYAKWTAHVASNDVALGTLSVNGEAITIVPSQLVYAVELPFGTTAIPTVAAAAADANAKACNVTQALAVDGSATIYVKAEDNTTEATYTINFSVATSKDIELVWDKSKQRCDATTPEANVLIAAMSQYLSASYTGSAEEGGSLTTGKTTGSKIIITAKPGYAFKAMGFYGKIQDGTCNFYKDGVVETIGTSTGDACYADVFSNDEVHEFAIELTGTNGVYIRNMQLTIIEACTPIVVAWDEEPVEFEVGKAGYAIAATANNGGDITYATADNTIIDVNASTGALTIAGLGSVALSASTPEGDGSTYCANGGDPIVLSKAVNTYYLVKFDGQNGEAADEVKYFSGDAAIALPSTPSYPGYDFKGWFDAETGGNQYTVAITPTASMTVYAQWVAQCDGATITTQPTGASYLTGRTPVALVCEATAGAGGTLTYEWFTCDDALKTNPVAATAMPSTAVAGTYYYFCKVTEEGCAVEAFSNVVTITVTDKDAICIIKSTPTSATEATVDGVYQGNAYFKGRATDKKLNSQYDYVGVELASGYTFLATDKVVLNQTVAVSGTDISKFYVFTEVPASGKAYATVLNASPVQGNNWFAMPTENVGQTTLYVGRVDANCNASVGYLAVYRACAPILSKITVNGVEGTPNNTNHVTIEVPASTTQGQLEAIAYEWVSNSDAWTAAHDPAAANAWEFGVENTVTFTDKDGDASEYYITVNKAAASSDATLSALTVNGQAVALADGAYAYDVELPYGTTVAPTVVATAHHAGAVATVDPCTLSGATITVVPESGAGDQQIYTLTFTVAKWKEIVIWDGSTMTALETSPNAETGLTWATTDFGSIGSYTTTCGEKSYSKYLPSGGASTGRYMTLTVPAGYVAKFYIVMATHSDTKERGMFIGSNLVKDPDETSVLELSNNDRDVAVAGMSEIVGAGTWYINPNNSIDFQEIRAYLRKGYARTSMLGAGVYGTVCVDHNVAVEDIQGVSVYELMGRENNYGKLVFDEIISGELEAGVPYVFQAQDNRMVLFYGNTKVDEPVDKNNGMYGTFTDQTLTELDDVYYFAQKALWSCSDLTSLSLPANRAYVKLSEIDYLTDPNPAPGRRRVTMSVNGEKIATGLDAINASEKPMKIMIDGQIYILRGEKVFDATGRLVK